MKFTLYFDHDIERTHVKKHNVSSEELYEFFTAINYFRIKRKDGSLDAIGKLKSNDRYLKVIYRQISSNHLFIITAYDVEEPLMIEFIEQNIEE